jgi:DNA-binding NtrC family response regulator
VRSQGAVFYPKINERRMGTEEKKSILVVDDENLILTTVERVLTKSGFHVEAALDSGRFLSLAKSWRFDFCIADLNMKDMTLEEIEKTVLEKNPEGRFLVMSGSGYSGPEPYLQKPFRIEDLRSLVREVLGGD